MAICMFSLAGVPPMVGFYAKLSVLQALIASGQAVYIALAVFAVMMSLIGAFYYLRVVKVMYFDAPVTATHGVGAGRRARRADAQRCAGADPGHRARRPDDAVCAGDRSAAPDELRVTELPAGLPVGTSSSARLPTCPNRRRSGWLSGALGAANLPFLNKRLLGGRAAGAAQDRCGLRLLELVAVVFRGRRRRPCCSSSAPARSRRRAGSSTPITGALVHHARVSRLRLALPVQALR